MCFCIIYTITIIVEIKYKKNILYRKTLLLSSGEARYLCCKEALLFNRTISYEL